MVQLRSIFPHISQQIINLFAMREVNSLNDRCICHYYKTKGLKKAKIGIIQTW